MLTTQIKHKDIKDINELIGLIGTPTYITTAGDLNQQMVIYCPILKNIVPEETLLCVKQGYALNKHIVCKTPHYKYSLNKVAYIGACCLQSNDIPFAFTFKVYDTRPYYTYRCNLLTKNLPIEIVDIVASYLGRIAQDNYTYKSKYTPRDFLFNFESEYQGPLPNQISRSQLLALYNMGIVLLAIAPIKGNYTTLTDESYDYVYPNNAPNRLHQFFETKESMYKYIEEVKQALNRDSDSLSKQRTEST